ncbi:MAG: hypothetical protein ACFFD8_04800 [Candidatus Thorarchaeota archaeon]
MKFNTLILFTLCCFLFPLLIQPMAIIPTPDGAVSSPSIGPLASASNSPLLPIGSPPLPDPDYAGVGAPRPVHEVANRTDGNQDVFLFYDGATQTAGTDSANVVLPPGWTGYRLDYSIYDLYENRTWALNPSFNGAATSWTSGYNDLGGANTFTQSWQSGGLDGNGYVRVQEDGRWESPYYRYDNNDRTWWTQTFSVNRSNIAWVALKMDYRVNSAWGSNALFNVYIRINGSQVWAKGFQSVGDTNWHNSGFLEFDAGLFDIPNSAIELEIGMFSTMSVGYSSNDWMRLEFDNVWLYMKTMVYPSEINLEMNGLDVENQINRGSGFVRQYPSTVWTTNPVVSNIVWTPTPNPPDPDLDIEVTGVCDLNLFANKTAITLYAQSPTATGVGFTAISGQNTSWTFYYQLALPSQYWNDVFNFTIPVDWDITFISEPQLPTVNKVSQCQGGDLGDGYLIVPTTAITNSPDGYWMIQAESHNYADSIELQIWDGGWTPTSAIRADNTTRVAARILDGLNTPPIGITSTQANVTIFEPGGGRWYSELVTPTAAGWIYTSSIYNDGWNTTGGTYYIYVNWDNSTEAGEISLSYTVQHATSLTPRESLIETFYEDQPLFPKVRYLDVDSDDWLEPAATIVGNWTTGTISFHYVSGTGYWEAEINALDPGDVGQYWIRVNASKSHYDSAFCFILIDIVAETVVYSPQAAGVYIPWRDNATIQIQYTRKTDSVGITGCVPYLEVTANWTTGFYTITETGNGWYAIELNGTGPGALGSYKLNITIYKERYQYQQFFITVTVREILTDLDFTNPTNVYWSQNTSIPLFYNDTDHGGIAIVGALVTCDWPDVYSVSDMYMLTLRTDNSVIGLHTVTITVSNCIFDEYCIEIRI